MRVLVPFGADPTNVITRDQFKITAESQETIYRALELFGDQPQAELIIVHLTRGEVDEKENMLEQVESMGEDYAATVTAGLRKLESIDESTEAIRKGLLDLVDEQRIDVVVLDYEHRSLTQQLFDSETIAETLLETRNTPVMFVPSATND